MAQHGLIGDNYGIDLPSVEVDKDELDEEKRMARFSKSKEYKKLKQIMESRIEFYQKALPDGRPLTEVDTAERAHMWVVANAVIGEFKMVLAAYEDANEVVKNVQ
jgi:shikimate kinase